MPLVKPGTIVVEPRRREEKDVEQLGGTVVLLEMDLATRLLMDSMARDEPDPARKGYSPLATVLAACVVGEGDAPVMTAAEWGAFGARHRDVAIDVANRVYALSGFGEDAAKN